MYVAKGCHLNVCYLCAKPKVSQCEVNLYSYKLRRALTPYQYGSYRVKINRLSHCDTYLVSKPLVIQPWPIDQYKWRVIINITNNMSKYGRHNAQAITTTHLASNVFAVFLAQQFIFRSLHWNPLRVGHIIWQAIILPKDLDSMP